ncbi:RALF domain-containing protein [Cephalotus follicularis]|uniref:RALF domain-containing protein n=1 Tax=Cephalotus follicularis TaxID=3775 RepID=A0A1Q3C0T6_CEPFO|nr:RALF domain-containing protein [Cephalotus follicularis]
MEKYSSSFLITLYLLLTALIFISLFGVDASGDHKLNWVPTKNRCQGSLAECIAADGEFELDSEINRRILATTDYISYGALQRNTVPCSQRGASYYNCQPGAEANSYTRGCTTITRCRG